MNEAIASFGAYVDGELQKVEGKTDKEIQGRQQQKLKALLGETRTSGFADPALMFKAQSGG